MQRQNEKKMYKTRNLPNTRIDVADALRGIAVAGIILYHSVEHFNIFTQEPIVHPLASDQTVADVLAWLLYLLWLWSGLLPPFRHHLRRDGWMLHGNRPISLRPLLVLQSPSRTARRIVEETYMDLIRI